MIKSSLKWLAVSILLLFLVACSQSHAPDWYTVTGAGVADPGRSRAQGRLMAKRAAKTDAQRQLLEAAKGVAISSTTTVEDFMTTDDYINSRVKGIIRGVRELDTRYLDDGSCEVDMQIDLNQVREIVR